MASIGEVKAALAQAAEQVLTGLRGVAVGTNHAKVFQAIQRAERGRQRLHEAATLIQGGATAAREHVGVLG
ncbi:hypothetical protein [Plantactinospora sp. BB1]|uniref:hypothetical protein n=1 Tax=Plantactinospora sp. BB1 TaxID=2071627 RepID=UPI000D154A01|nr:hypothetical protein [Plantactinospora sp. BB1]AVT37282.1 hypothetical protein C6W10_13325 [Plantactinospora sp. BB1]